ncbi:energy transducer TonB [Polaribacter sp. Z014]|uniref:energy transducer TonB n=1 Tax=Polaribacter sp. Z014 TaxID=2927126 RepID=UPI0020212136|nr:energy transducer TonB [Polaribacter sp. Z014]MCL7762414.1 energy transducer TonB [Polaribacter sp. Z014]
MNSKFKITIPKPCHENWNIMTPMEKGRFCSSCSKTVIDFTKKSTSEIQEYLVENKNQRVCGHFYKKQLDSITIEIPQVTFQQQLSFQKLFILALFFVMGTTLFSCQYTDGKKQKIENIILVDTIKKVEKEIDSLTIEKKTTTIPVKRTVPPVPKTTGITFCEATSKKDSIIEITTLGELPIEGDISYVELEEDFVLGMFIQEPPRFKSSKKLSGEKARKDFDSRLKKYFQENFNFEKAQNLGLREGKYKIFTQFIIDTLGNVIDIKVRAPHPTLKKEVRKILQKMPQFIPGKQRNKAVKTKYNLPITFVVE